MNKSQIIGIVLIFAIFIAYSYWMTPSKKELEAQRIKADSIAWVAKKQDDSARREEAIRQASEKIRLAQLAAAGKTEDTMSVKKAALHEQLGAFAISAIGKNDHFALENEYLKIRIAAQGGKIDYVELKNYKAWDDKPLVLFNGDSLHFGLTFFSNNRVIRTDKLFFRPWFGNRSYDPGKPISVSGNDSVTFSMRLYANATDTAVNPGKYIEFLYTLHGKDYMLGYKVNFVGMADVIDPNTKYLVLDWSAELMRQEKNVKLERINSTIYYKFFEEKVDYLSETKDEEKNLKNEKIKWISFKQQFFSSSIIAGTYFSEPKLKTLTLAKNDRYMKSMATEIGIPYTPTGSQTIPMSIYYGPNRYYGLKAYHQDLERQIPLGWGFFLMAWINIYAVIPVFTFFGNFGWNYGIIILVLTILLKIILFPIAFKTYKSSAKMRALKPDIDEIGKRYPKKEEAMKKQSATMELYKKAGVNPMAGCVPLLLQMPILFAMFRFFPSSIELRQQPFLWATDLSSYDSIWTFPGGFSIPWYGDHVSLFALLMTISSIFYTRINDQMMGSTQTQMPGMKTMMYLMPVMFLFWFNDYSSGLSYYYLLANLLTFAQIYIIRSTIDEKKLHAQIEANKKKPVKKSGFQKRLEDMAKQRGYNSKK